MHQELEEHLNKALMEFSEGRYQDLLEAKEEYFSLTGTALEEDEDFESIMNSFNDWYLTGFIPKKDTQTAVKKYILNHELSSEIAFSLTRPLFSLFEYHSTENKGKIVLKDIFYKKKIFLSKAHSKIALLEKDLFLGRLINYKDQYWLMKGISLFPGNIKKNIKKEIDRVYKLNDFHQAKQFLFRLEKLKNKWKRYGHIDAAKIFSEELIKDKK